MLLWRSKSNQNPPQLAKSTSFNLSMFMLDHSAKPQNIVLLLHFHSFIKKRDTRVWQDKNLLSVSTTVTSVPSLNTEYVASCIGNESWCWMEIQHLSSLWISGLEDMIFSLWDGDLHGHYGEARSTFPASVRLGSLKSNYTVVHHDLHTNQVNIDMFALVKAWWDGIHLPGLLFLTE